MNIDQILRIAGPILLLVGFLFVTVGVFWLILTRRYWFVKKWHALFNRKPCYRITESGVRVKYFNFSEHETLPFDRDTYEECQVFIGSFANPFYVDIKDINEEYDVFDKSKHRIEGKHVIPSQKYKRFMEQSVLRQIFSATGMDMQKLTWLLVGSIGINVVLLIVVIGVNM